MIYACMCQYCTKQAVELRDPVGSVRSRLVCVIFVCMRQTDRERAFILEVAVLGSWHPSVPLLRSPPPRKPPLQIRMRELSFSFFYRTRRKKSISDCVQVRLKIHAKHVGKPKKVTVEK